MALVIVGVDVSIPIFIVQYIPLWFFYEDLNLYLREFHG